MIYFTRENVLFDSRPRPTIGLHDNNEMSFNIIGEPINYRHTNFKEKLL